MGRIELFYDIVSPYSLFAFHTLLRYEKAFGFELVLRPFFLGGACTCNRPRLIPVPALLST